MKKNTLAFIAAFGALAATSVWAAQDKTLINFTPLGDTYYADGVTKVGAGEWWALCWSPDATFSGLRKDLSPVDDGDDGDKLLLKGRVFTEKILFQLEPSEVQEGGYYYVVVLDTRDASGNPTAANDEGAPAVMNGCALATGALELEAVAGAKASAPAESVSGSYLVDASSLANGEPAKITEFNVAGDYVLIKVENLLPSVTYVVTYGASLENIKQSEYKFPRDGLATWATFQLKKDDAKFFKLGVK